MSGMLTNSVQFPDEHRASQTSGILLFRTKIGFCKRPEYCNIPDVCKIRFLSGTAIFRTFARPDVRPEIVQNLSTFRTFSRSNVRPEIVQNLSTFRTFARPDV